MFILFLAISLFIYINNSTKTVKTVTKANEVVSKNDKDDKENNEEEQELKTFYVDVKGQVNNPGVYLVNEKNIVNDAIEFAGGLTKDADTKCINLSKKLEEEMVIYIYSSKETKSMTSTKTNSNLICDNVVNNAYQNVQNQTSTSNQNSSNTKSDTNESVGIININTADVDTLTKLTGIGESKAKDIINYRNQNGLFKSIEEIKNVSGIGDSTYSKIKDQITV